MSKRSAQLGVGAIALICIAATDSLRNLPSMAVYGWKSIFWYTAGTALFLIPISLVAAELATSLPVKGGLFTWIRSAFGERTGFFGVWCEWASNVVWFPAILSFTAGSLAYAFDPNLANNPTYLVTVMLVVFWSVILLNFLGTRFSSHISAFGSISGTIIPQILLLVLAAAYVLRGSAIQIPFSRSALSPNFSLTSLPLLATMITMFAGMEIAGYHAASVRKPARDYPRAILLACLVIFTLSVLGTLAIAIVVPVEQLNLSAGLMQAFSDFLSEFNLQSWIPWVAILVAVGSIATISTWMLGPSKGIQAAATRGNLPPTFQGLNRNAAPTSVLVITGICGSLFILMFLFIPSVNASYWILSALTTQILTLMYFLCFAAALRLRYKQPDLPRPYRIPGGKIGLWVVCSAGAFACLFALTIGFIPPSTIPSGDWLKYILFMLSGFVVLSCPPFLFMAFKKASWKAKGRLAAADQPE